MSAPRYVYIHGWGVKPDGAKARLMREHLAPAEVLTFNWHVPSYAATTTTAALAEVESRLAGGRWNVVGSSQGGYLAALLAQRRPDLVNALVLLSPSFDNLSPEAWVGQMAADNPQWGDGPEQERQCEPPPPVGPYNNVDDSGGLDYAFVRDLEQFPRFPEVACPTTVVHALDDADVNVEHAFGWVQLHARRGLPVTVHVLPTLDEAQKIDHGLYHFAKADSGCAPTFKQVLERQFTAVAQA